MDNVKDLIHSELVKECILEIKDNSSKSEVAINEIINLVNISVDHIEEYKKNGILSRCISNVFGDKQSLSGTNQNWVELQKLSLDLLDEMINNNLVQTNLVKNVIDQLEETQNDNSEITTYIKKILINLHQLEQRIEHLNHKMPLQEIILKIEYESYHEDIALYSILHILSDLKISSLTGPHEVELLKTVINKNIIETDEWDSLKSYLIKISLMENLRAQKIHYNLEISDDNLVVKSIADTLLFASDHDEIQKKFEFTIMKLPEVATYIDVDEYYTINELLSFLIDGLLSKYKQIRLREQMKDPEEKISDPEEINIEISNSTKSKIINLLMKHNEFISRKYNFYNYTLTDLKKQGFDYRRYFREINHDIFHALEQLEEKVIFLFLSIILGDIEALETISGIEEIVNTRHPATNYTPILIACQFGKLDVVKYLIEYGANLYYTVSQDQENAMTLAIENNHLEVVKYLFEEGVNDFNHNLIALSYHNNALDMINMVDTYYLKKIKFGDFLIPDIVPLYIEKIAMGTYFEFYPVRKKYKKHRSAVLACKNMLNNAIHPKEVIGTIDLTRFKSMKEGVIFTNQGIYMKYSKNKDIIKIYQPYLTLTSASFNHNKATFNNVVDAKIYDYDVIKSYDLTLPEINNHEIYKLLYTISDIVTRQKKA